MYKHTPAPWKIKGDNTAMKIVGKDGLSVATIMRTSKADASTKQANACLIRVSPDLLKALSRLAVASGEADALQHAGLDVPPKVWAEINAANIEAGALFNQLEGD
jgi:hypothetical protein